jgi:adenylate kinase family enzyme
MRILISGGPGSGCTSTASSVSAALNLPVFDSDSFFHKLTDPPFQEQYEPDERRKLLQTALAGEEGWILSGSIATWGLPAFTSTHGIFLEIPNSERLRRIEKRQINQFGSRIDRGGDMAEEHRSFLQWADSYESRTGTGRNLTTDRAFLKSRCNHFIAITEVTPIQELVTKVIKFINETRTAEQADAHPY